MRELTAECRDLGENGSRQMQGRLSLELKGGQGA